MDLRLDVSVNIYGLGLLRRLKDEYISKRSLRLEEAKRNYLAIFYKRLRY
jgi:hypothetical protein